MQLRAERLLAVYRTRIARRSDPVEGLVRRPQILEPGVVIRRVYGWRSRKTLRMNLANFVDKLSTRAVIEGIEELDPELQARFPETGVFKQPENSAVESGAVEQLPGSCAKVAKGRIQENSG